MRLYYRHLYVNLNITIYKAIDFSIKLSVQKLLGEYPSKFIQWTLKHPMLPTTQTVGIYFATFLFCQCFNMQHNKQVLLHNYASNWLSTTKTSNLQVAVPLSSTSIVCRNRIIQHTVCYTKPINQVTLPFLHLMGCGRRKICYQIASQKFAILYKVKAPLKEMQQI